ncbi:IS3 family transposase [Chromobacterium violaceum]|nr:IS3 family transposase [Chromobacterium violaceum]
MESFFQLLKRERINRQTYHDEEEARRDIFDYIEFFYNSKRRMVPRRPPTFSSREL